MLGLSRRDTLAVGIICVAQMCMTLSSFIVQWNEVLMEQACSVRNLTFPSTECNENAGAQHEASLREGWMALAVAWPNVLTISIISAAADWIGRKPAIIASLLGQAVFTSCIWLLPLSGELCIGHNCIENYWGVLAITAVGSLTGGSPVTLAVMFAVLGDVSIGMSAKARTRMYVVLEVFQWIGATAGPLSGVFVAEHFGGLRAAFGFYTSCLLLSAFLVSWCPETLTSERAVSFSFCRATPVANLRPFVQHPVLIRFAITWGPPLCLGGAFISSTGNLYLMDVGNFTMLDLAELATATTLCGTVALAVGLPLQQACGMGTRAIILTAYWLGSLSTISWAVLQLVHGHQGLIRAVVYTAAVASADVHVLAPVIRSLLTSISLSGEVDVPVASMLGSVPPLLH